MSVERIFVWTCDACRPLPKTVTKSGYGLPPGWTWHPNGITGLFHRCDECTAKAEASNG